MTFLRPVTREHEYVTVEAQAEERAGKQVQLSGTVRIPEGKTVATCMATCRILDNMPS